MHSATASVAGGGELCACGNLTAYRQHLASRSSEATTRLYCYLVLRAHADIGDRLFDRTHVRRYIENRPRQQHRILTQALRDYYAWLVSRGLLERDLLELRAVRVGSNKPPRALTRDELEALIEGCRQRGEIGPRLAEAVTLHAMIGVRPGELLALTVSDFNFDTDLVTVYATKTQRYRVIPLNQRAREAALRLCQGRTGRILGWSTRHYYNILREAGALAGLPKGRAFPYALRHTCATLLLRGGTDIEIVREVLGHTSLQHTINYVKADGSALRGALGTIG